METKLAKIKHDENLKRKVAAMLISFWVFVFMSFVLLMTTAQPVAAESIPCTPGEIIENCEPPSFRDIEFTLATCVTSAWALAGLIFGYYFIANIVVPYFSMNPDKMGDASKAFWPWLGGFVIFFLANPIIANVMGLFINTQSECYGALAAPGFSLFFPSVCTEGDSLQPVVKGTITLANGDSISEEATVYLVRADTNEVAKSTSTENDGSYEMFLTPEEEYNLVVCLSQGGSNYLGRASGVSAASGEVTRNFALPQGDCPYN